MGNPGVTQENLDVIPASRGLRGQTLGRLPKKFPLTLAAICSTITSIKSTTAWTKTASQGVRQRTRATD